MLSQTKAREIYRDVKTEWKWIRTYTRRVMDGDSTGYFLWGTGGTGKSFQVLKELQKKRFVHINSRITGAGFFDLLEDQPSAIFLIEEAETIFEDKAAIGLLRSALWGQGQRKITWTISQSVKNKRRGGHRSVTFTGGVIVVSNEPLKGLGTVKALATRIPTQELSFSNEQLQATMLVLSEKKWENGKWSLDATECKTVVRFMLGEIEKHAMKIDLRLREHAFTAYSRWKAGKEKFCWQDSVVHLVEQSAASQEDQGDDGQAKTRAERKRMEQFIVKGIVEKTTVRERRIDLWQRETGKSKSAFYRRLAEVQG